MPRGVTEQGLPLAVQVRFVAPMLDPAMLRVAQQRRWAVQLFRVQGRPPAVGMVAGGAHRPG